MIRFTDNFYALQRLRKADRYAAKAGNQLQHCRRRCEGTLLHPASPLLITAECVTESLEGDNGIF